MNIYVCMYVYDMMKEQVLGVAQGDAYRYTVDIGVRTQNLPPQPPQPPTNKP